MKNIFKEKECLFCSQFQATVHHQREVKATELKIASQNHSYGSTERMRAAELRTPLAFSMLIQGSAHELMQPTLGVDLPTTFKTFRRHAPGQISLMFLVGDFKL